MHDIFLILSKYLWNQPRMLWIQRLSIIYMNRIMFSFVMHTMILIRCVSMYQCGPAKGLILLNRNDFSTPMTGKCCWRFHQKISFSIGPTLVEYIQPNLNYELNKTHKSNVALCSNRTLTHNEIHKNTHRSSMLPVKS